MTHCGGRAVIANEHIHYFLVVVVLYLYVGRPLSAATAIREFTHRVFNYHQLGALIEASSHFKCKKRIVFTSSGNCTNFDHYPLT